MNKICTDIEQSKKLAEFLPIETADMYYSKADVALGEMESYPNILHREEIGDDIPCWSLTALLELIPKSIISTPNPFSDNYCCRNIEFDMEFYADNAVDAVFEMVVWLKENEKL